LRHIPPREVAKTALSLQEAGARYFFITDSVFNSDCDHSMAVAEEFKQAGVSIPWGAFFAPIKPPDDYYKIMSDAGLKHVEFGTESLTDRVLSFYRKPFRVENIFASHSAAVAAGLNVAHYFLFGGPGETEATLRETLLNVDKLKETVLFFFCGMRIYPHTALYDIAIREGCISKSQNLLEPVFYKGKVGTEKIISMVKAAKKDRINWVIGSGGEDVSETVSKMYERGFTGPLWEYLIR
ncbi:MAG: radical SAM protein, partial [Deltaproteobacteria bacterium]|nr:radical SAM protein [Deltaproteobacteria bacterium]